MKAKLFLPEGNTDKDGQRRLKTYLEKNRRHDEAWYRTSKAHQTNC